MVTYNSSKFIIESIVSILNQTFKNFELIICDDNSTDNTWEIICSYNDDRIIKIKNERNLGEYQNRNKAIALAKGEWIIFIDGDDILYEFGLEIMLSQAIKNIDCGMVITRPWDERILYPIKISPKQLYQFQYLDTSIIGINFTKVLFKRSAILDVGCFDNQNIKMGDAYIQYRIGMLYPSLIMQDGFSWWRRRKGQASEKLIKNTHLYILDSYLYLLPMLKDKNNPLSNEEKKIAFNNIYGNYLRFLCRQFLYLKIFKVFNLLKKHPIPIKYLKAIAIPQQREYFNKYSGENPLTQCLN